MKRTITVLQDDIDHGCKRDSDNCAIARAATRDLADLLEDGASVGVSNTCLTVWGSAANSLYMARLPEKARGFIMAFDAGFFPPPFKFEIELEATHPAE